MQAQQLNLNVISNNIANVNTTGYKKNKIEFQDLLYQNPRQAGGQTGAGNVIPTGVEMGNGTKVVSTAKIFTQGQLTQTSEKMDVAIDGVGFFQVERPDGTEAYTRDGAFKVGPDGQITTADALALSQRGCKSTLRLPMFSSPRRVMFRSRLPTVLKLSGSSNSCVFPILPE